MNNRISIIGATTWGNTLASLIASNGMPVRVWAHKREKAEALQLAAGKQGRVEFTTDAEYVVDRCNVAIFAVPAQSLRLSARLFADRIHTPVLVSAAKGLEADSGKTMTQVLAEEIRSDGPAKLAVISGPNLSKEINLGLPAVTMIASKDDETGRMLRQLLMTDKFSVYTSRDIKGVEICGALKNVIALGAGLSDGLGLGSNAKAALVTVGWQEVIKLGSQLGADRDTFYGFAGLGDLVTTCISPLSRNYHVGHELADGKPLTSILAGMSNVVEGVGTAKAVHLLSMKAGLELPLMEAIFNVLYGQLAPSGISRYFLNGHGRV